MVSWFLSRRGQRVLKLFLKNCLLVGREGEIWGLRENENNNFMFLFYSAISTLKQYVMNITMYILILMCM